LPFLKTEQQARQNDSLFRKTPNTKVFAVQTQKTNFQKKNTTKLAVIWEQAKINNGVH